MKIEHTVFTEYLVSKQGLHPFVLVFCGRHPGIVIVSSSRKAQVHLPECWAVLWRTRLYTEAHSNLRGQNACFKRGTEGIPSMINLRLQIPCSAHKILCLEED